jgi:DNA-binding response OmpR family regulator
MTSAPTIPTLGLVNTSEEITDLLGAVFRMEGFRVVSAYVLDFKREQQDFEAFLRPHQPQVVIWDIAIPYKENWTFFQAVAQSEAAQGCRFVLTTVNKRALDGLVGETPAHELLGKPYDLDVIIAAVQRALGDADVDTAGPVR